MNFPPLDRDLLFKRLQPPKGKVDMVLDTDTYNEIDDQFALAYALRSPEKLNVKAIYAAPFHNDRSSGPKDGMEKSYAEIQNILSILGTSREVYKGSVDYLADEETPQPSEAAGDLVKRAMAYTDEPLYVVAIGAITNVASAILMEPDIIKHMVVVWLGGHAFHWPDTKEFNLYQDVRAARVIFDSGVPLIHVPCCGVTTHLLTTVQELEYYLAGKSKIGDYLTDIVKGYTNTPYGWSKVIWDVATIAWLINPDWVPAKLVGSPKITDNVTWEFEGGRQPINSAFFMYRDAIFADLFKKLSI